MCRRRHYVTSLEPELLLTGVGFVTRSLQNTQQQASSLSDR